MFSVIFGLNLSAPFCLEPSILEMYTNFLFNPISTYSKFHKYLIHFTGFLFDFIISSSLQFSFVNKGRSFISFCRLNSDTNWKLKPRKWTFFHQSTATVSTMDYGCQIVYSLNKNFVENNKQSQVSCLKFRYLFYFVWICVLKHKIKKQVTQQLILLRTEWSFCFNFNAVTCVYVWYSTLNIHISIVWFLGSPIVKFNWSADINVKILLLFFTSSEFITVFCSLIFYLSDSLVGTTPVDESVKLKYAVINFTDTVIIKG